MNFYAKQLTVPECLITIPTNLNEDYWFVLAKPDGIRSLVFTTGAKTIARDKNGEIILEFNSAFDGGSSKKTQARILDF